MFDPSKLDLDIENEKNSDQNENTQEQKNIELHEKYHIENDVSSEKPSDTIETIEEKNEDSKAEAGSLDILASLSVDENQDEKDTVSYGETPSNNYDKEDIVSQSLEEKAQEEVPASIIYDVNINKIEDVLIPLHEKEYDFVTIEPNEDYVTVVYRKDKVIVDQKNIKFPLYSQLLLKVKSVSKLKMEETAVTQEGKSEINLLKKVFQLGTKTAPGDF